MDRKSFVFYKSWKTAMLKLPVEVKVQVYESLVDYATSQTIPEMSETANIAFEFIKTDLDRDIEKYLNIVEVNRRNGLKGGRKPKNKKPMGSSSTKPNPQNLDNDNVNGNDNVNDMKKESTNVDKKETAVSSCSHDYNKFLNWLSQNAPYCGNPKNFPQQITETEFDKLKARYTGNQIADIIEELENRKDLRKRYTNLYRTVLNWAKRAYEK